MKKKLFTIYVFSIVLWSFTTSSADALTRGQDEISIIPPIIIRPPVNKQKIEYYDILFRDKSTFVDTFFEV